MAQGPNSHALFGKVSMTANAEAFTLNSPPKIDVTLLLHVQFGRGERF
jgi:hypothetical protein